MDYQAIFESLIRGLIGERFIVFALAAIGLNLHFGYTGLLNFGQAVFMAAGAYGLAMMVATIGPRLNENTGLNMSETTLFWVGVFMAVIVFPVVFALVMGVPTLRLRADYLAIVTIAVAEICARFTPEPAPRPIATVIDIGVARPSAQGQAMITVLTATTTT